MPKKRNFNSIVIDARRWRDKTYGNTYHSVAVYVDGELVGLEPFHYGYDQAYLQTAHEILARAGIFSWKEDKALVEGRFFSGEPSGSFHEKGHDNKQEAWQEFTDYMREHRNKIVETVSDVSRKSDLHEGGKRPRVRVSRSKDRRRSGRRSGSSRPTSIGGTR